MGLVWARWWDVFGVVRGAVWFLDHMGLCGCGGVGVCVCVCVGVWVCVGVSVGLSVCLSANFVCKSVCMSVCLPANFVCLSVCLPILCFWQQPAFGRPTV